MPRCPTCNSSTLRYGNGQYTCHGDISEWSKCTFKTRDVVRNPAPYRLPLDIELPQSCRPTDASCRFDRVLPRSDSPKAEGSTTEPHGIFSGMTLMLVGKLEGSKTEWTKKIEEAGGVVVGSVDASVDCVVTNAAWMQREVESGRLYKARKMLVPVVGEGFLTEAFDAGRLNIAKFTLPGYEPAAGGDDRRMGDPAIRTVNVKGQVEVHEDSGLQQTGHVLQENKHVYHATMTLSDQATGANSFYTLQVIQRNGAVGERGCYLFRAWGRVGDSRVGNHKLEDMLKYEAVDRFIELFEDKSGNSWQSWMANKGARKIAGKYYPIELDYGQDNVAKAKVVQERLSKNAEQAAAESDLDPKTIELLQMLFDMQTYRSALLEMDINADQMPLGKLSKSHIEQGFNLLTEIQSLLAEVDGEVDAARRDALVLDASNRFNTIVPQRTPALIDSMSQLSSKVAMVDALRNMEVAANMLVGDCPDTSLVQNYTRLGCQIEPLADPQEIQMIDKWLQNGRGPTHKEWTLELQDVFAVDRDGERVRFQPFKALPNRMLLFHGSRISNFVGILSQGARIAPKEAPSTGYMFGKGVYFADVPTKSAQYCFPTRANPHGLLLVCEVALGRTHDVREAQFMDAPPRGRHSTRALGKHMPDTLQEIITPDGTKIPCGTPIHNQEVIDKGTELMYNEYVVYDTSQVRMKYLLKVRFNYNKK